MKKKLLVFLIIFFSITFNSFSIEPDICLKYEISCDEDEGAIVEIDLSTFW